MSSQQTFDLKHSDGSSWVTVNPGTVNTDTSLELPGYGYNGIKTWTHIVDQNFLNLLENFNNDTPPKKPTLGQLWFNKGNQTLNVLSLNGWKALSSVCIQDIPPDQPALGDFWFNTLLKKLAYYNGTGGSGSTKGWVYVTENGIPNANTILVNGDQLRNTAFDNCKTVQDVIDVLVNLRTAGSIMCTDNNGKMNILPISGDISLSNTTKTKNYFSLNTSIEDHQINGSYEDNPYMIKAIDAWYHIITTSDPQNYIAVNTKDTITRPTTIINRSGNTVGLSKSFNPDFVYNMIPPGGYITFMYNNNSTSQKFNIIDTNMVCSSIDQNAYAYYGNIAANSSFNTEFNGIIDSFIIYNNSTSTVATITLSIDCLCSDSITRTYNIKLNTQINPLSSLIIPRFGVNRAITLKTDADVSILINGNYQADLWFAHIATDGASISGYKTVVSVTTEANYTVFLNGKPIIVDLTNLFNVPIDPSITMNVKCSNNYGVICAK